MMPVFSIPSRLHRTELRIEALALEECDSARAKVRSYPSLSDDERNDLLALIDYREGTLHFDAHEGMSEWNKAVYARASKKR